MERSLEGPSFLPDINREAKRNVPGPKVIDEGLWL